jgi:hypothetical protein
MSNRTSQDVYTAARNLLPELNKAMRTSIAALLARADAGEKVDNFIIDLIATDSAASKKLRKALYFDEDYLSIRDFIGLAGDPSSPIAEKYVCPRKGCKHFAFIQKTGEIPEKCPKHGVDLIHTKKRGK